jgi:hypothetical protein
MEFPAFVLMLLGVCALLYVAYRYVLLPWGDWLEDRRVRRQRKADNDRRSW